MLLLLMKCPHTLFLQQEPQTILSFRNPRHGALQHRSPIHCSHRLVLYSFSSFSRKEEVFLLSFTIKPWSASCWKGGHGHQGTLITLRFPSADLSRCLYTKDSHAATSTYCNICRVGTLFSGCSKVFLPESRICNDIKLRDGALKFRFFWFFMKKAFIEWGNFYVRMLER